MDRFIKYLHSIKKYGEDERKTVNIFKRVNDVVTNNKEDYDNFEILDTQRNKIRKWMLDNLSLGTVCNYTTALSRAVDSMDVAQNKKDEIKRFYLYIDSETQRLRNRKSGKVTSDFKPKRAIEEINEMIQSKP